MVNLVKLDKINPHSQEIDLYHKTYVNCKLIYYQYQDSIFYDMQKKFEEYNIVPSNVTDMTFPSKSNFILDSFFEFCNLFPYMTENNMFRIYEDLNSKIINLYYRYEYSNPSYENLKRIYDDPILKEVFSIILLIIRPIREFTKNNLTYPLVQNSINQYLIFNIIFLCVNFVVDIVLFVLILKKVINIILKVNKHFMNIINCLKN